ncbi:hypothetical protein F4V43_02550 [Paenibacillus spiritus]|uniref:Uncharacterized protein n=1 Tax=Paenibacillus spiritus TaxID=2496557 RepID=A0A5J5GH22_9BACL|nr:hypothetical protein [Paenibacillus spiritus]KAA9007387.1 hypothetical protein F4V43_02550 [Paenibacillus spiritus]
MSESSNLIFGRPDYIEGVGLVYPIRLKDYDRFQEVSSVLYYSKKHFGEEYDSFYLLDLIVLGLREDSIIHSLQDIFRIVCRNPDVTFYWVSDSEYGFKIDENHEINRSNYEIVRAVIMHQNIMIEQRVYKSKLAQEWAEKALKAKSKNGVKILFEDIVSTVSVYTGKHYWDLENYTIYQLQTDYHRINKLKEYDTSIQIMCVSGKGNLGHFSEHVDLFKDPYDDVFIDKEQSKLGSVFG